MPGNCLLYYITDRTAFPGDETARRCRMIEKIAEAARAGVDYIQLREKDLSTRELESLARDAVDTIRESGRWATGNRQVTTALLINSRSDIAMAVQADGVHLRSDDISPQETREIWRKCGAGALAREKVDFEPLIGVSCHSPADVCKAAADGATFAVFGPVFEKKDAPGARASGLGLLREICQLAIPVLALGGVTLANARACLEAGAAGVAGIRLFQENDISSIAENLRALCR